MRVLETGNYIVVHFGLCEAGKGGVGDGLFFFFSACISFIKVAFIYSECFDKLA